VGAGHGGKAQQNSSSKFGLHGNTDSRVEAAGV
jgi:hypothetical protein